MRIKLDENLPDRLISVLSGLGHDTDTVVGEGFSGKPDRELWPEVQKAGRFLLTKDLGFSDERVYPPGTHHGILVLRLSDDRSIAAAERLGAVFRTEAVEAWKGNLVVVTDHKVRVRLPQARR
jgi:predicted nuclease of predicted toxin-antitoxin system